MSPPVRLGLLGLGNVAQGLLELWTAKPDPRFRIAWATDSTGAVVSPGGIDAAALLNAKRGAGLRGLRGATFGEGARPEEVRTENPCDVLVNLLPCNYENGQPALATTRAALEEGTSVVSAEKASLVLGFEAIRRSAAAGGATFRYSACVGGSVPFIPILEWVQQAHEIRRITGVINATTTYILSELEARRHSGPEILERCRQLGILERDPRHDLEGYDLAAKAVIVHNTIYREPIPWQRATRAGITEFLENPEKLRTGTRLVATIEPQRVHVESQVLPMHSPLRVYGFENALVVDTPHAGELYVRGVGAGGRGTATNVYGDLLRVLQDRTGGEKNRAGPPVPSPTLHAHL